MENPNIFDELPFYDYNDDSIIEVDNNEIVSLEIATIENFDCDQIGLSALAVLFRKQGLRAEKMKRIQKMIKIYSLAIELGDAYAMNNLAVYYEQYKFPDETIRKYYRLAVQNAVNCDPIYNFADYYKNKKDYDNMTKYYKLAVDEFNDIESMLQLGMYYSSIGKTDEEELYFMKAFNITTLDGDYRLLVCNNQDPPRSIDINDIWKNFDACTRIFKFNTDELVSIVDFCDKNSNIPKDNIVLKCIMKLYNADEKINIYRNKVILFTRLQNTIECGICYETRLNIDLKCGHCVCTKCYFRLVSTICPFCRI